MLFKPGVDGTTSLSDLHPAAFTGDSVYAWSPQPQIVLHRKEKAGDFPRRKAHTLNVVLGQHSAEAAVCSLDIRQEGDLGGLIFRLGGSHLRVKGTLYLLTTVSVKMRPIRCPETSVNNYHTTPRNIPEERRSHQHRGGSLKSR
jgi:hypothetical protein